MDSAESDRSRHRARIMLWLCSFAAASSIALLVVAVVGRDPGDGPTLRPREVGDSMSQAQAYEAADSTVRAWVRERNARNLANLEALTCLDNEGTVTAEVDAVRKKKPVGKPMHVVSTGALGRHDSLWTLSTHFDNDVSVQFVLGVRGGQLQVCPIASAPVP
ncbi:hypothetical protein [Mycobacterium sp. TY814]|uniref:hypothetical protein n=1 Tax=unclassified Mycobacterium TaxID=2642494 RepID=UPI00274129CD|nr:hypothetical protein [Mycobacterium sp. TY814]MDP7723521.1 hypothetical protein [Mycobacterium sp. TY814]